MKQEPSQLKATRYSGFLIKVLPLLSFAVPLAALYLLNPLDTYLNVSVQASFELMWKGRTFQMFFLWLIALEFILSWDNIQTKLNLQNKTNIAVYALVLLLPSLYLVLEFGGLNAAIADLSAQSGVAFANSMPLAVEYLAFAALFCLVSFVAFGKKGLRSFALPALFAMLVGVLYTIDNIYPYGEFTPFQLLVPTTASLAAGVLGLMGYTVVSGFEASTGMPTLDVSGALGQAKFAIAWPCAGIESLLIFTAVALLFLKGMKISWKAKIGFFALGAAVTYFINVLRIVTIFTIGMQHGVNSIEVQNFHFYYGPLYAMTWIVAYPLLILGLTMAWQKFRRHPPEPLNPA
ncbi:MAG: archaeosortase/exosortase family protein [Candidatus Bathyarchaeota archaeon]|nr:archaeosortase/exosortase family protein [Candidatus Bathyarchaeota archaeon]